MYDPNANEYNVQPTHQGLDQQGFQICLRLWLRFLKCHFTCRVIEDIDGKIERLETFNKKAALAHLEQLNLPELKHLKIFGSCGELVS